MSREEINLEKLLFEVKEPIKDVDVILYDENGKTEKTHLNEISLNIIKQAIKEFATAINNDDKEAFSGKSPKEESKIVKIHFTNNKDFNAWFKLNTHIDNLIHKCEYLYCGEEKPE